MSHASRLREHLANHSSECYHLRPRFSRFSCNWKTQLVEARGRFAEGLRRRPHRWWPACQWSSNRTTPGLWSLTLDGPLRERRHAQIEKCKHLVKLGRIQRRLAWPLRKDDSLACRCYIEAERQGALTQGVLRARILIFVCATFAEALWRFAETVIFPGETTNKYREPLRRRRIRTTSSAQTTIKTLLVKFPTLTEMFTVAHGKR